jgi:hypothetical protein
MNLTEPSSDVEQEVVALGPGTHGISGTIKPDAAEASPLKGHPLSECRGSLLVYNRTLNLKGFGDGSHARQDARECNDGVGSCALRLASDHSLKIVQRELVEMGRTDKQECLKYGSRDPVADSRLGVTPAQQ